MPVSLDLVTQRDHEDWDQFVDENGGTLFTYLELAVSVSKIWV